MIKNQTKKEGMRSRRARARRWSVGVWTVLSVALCLIGAPRASASGALGAGARLVDGVTYVPFRAFCEAADNCEVRWDASTRTARATTSTGAVVTARQGAEYLSYGERVFYTVAPIRIIGDRLYVPVRPLAKCFGVKVSWSAATRTATLTPTGKPARSDSGVYDADALYWLSRIVHAEAGGEPFRGKLAVANVVLNRVSSSAFPNSIYGVIFDRKHGVQFSPTADGRIYQAPSQESVAAAKAALEGYSLSDRILYFFNPSIAASHWISANRTYAFRIGGHVFYV